MLRLLYRQRRRMLFTAFFFTLTICLALLPSVRLMTPEAGIYILAISFTITLLICFAGIMLATGILVILLPGMRTLPELLAVVSLMDTVVHRSAPDFMASHVWAPFLPIVFVIILINVFYGTWLDRFRLWLDHNEKRSMVLKQTPDEIWDWLCAPPSADGGETWEPLVKEAKPVEGEDQTYEVQYRLGHSLFEHQTIRYTNVKKPHYVEYEFEGEMNPVNRNLVRGTFAIRVEAIPGTSSSKVTITRTRKSLLLREGLLMWFDDSLGDLMDFIRAGQMDKRDWSLAGRFRRQAVAMA